MVVAAGATVTLRKRACTGLVLRGWALQRGDVGLGRLEPAKTSRCAMDVFLDIWIPPEC